MVRRLSYPWQRVGDQWPGASGDYQRACLGQLRPSHIHLITSVSDDAQVERGVVGNDDAAGNEPLDHCERLGPGWRVPHTRCGDAMQRYAERREVGHRWWRLDEGGKALDDLVVLDRDQCDCAGAAAIFVGGFEVDGHPGTHGQTHYVQRSGGYPRLDSLTSRRTRPIAVTELDGPASHATVRSRPVVTARPQSGTAQ